MELTAMDTIIKLLGSGGLAVAVAALIVGGVQEWYVWGPSHKRLLEFKDNEIARLIIERDQMIAKAEARTEQWEDIALRSLNIAEKKIDKS